ncbi:DUF6603 domain-containing protein [Chitinophaga sp. 30R24]|uniref:DUF6603 domain-containing protein n=1 Tax=Chitinophaga sp. 30R24 TaxID=3248838 RepID=UPI003B8FAF8F
MASLIEQIIEKMEAIPIQPNGDMLLQPSDFGLPFMDTFFNRVLRQQSLLLSDANKVPPGADSVTVTGVSGILGYLDLQLQLTFDVKEEEVVGTVTAAFPDSYQPAMPVLYWIKAGYISFITSLTENYSVVSFEFKLQVLTDVITAGIPIDLKGGSANQWQIMVAADTDQDITPAALGSLLAGQNINEFLPPALSAILSGFKLNSLDIVYDTATPAVAYVTTGFSVTNGWTIVDKQVVLLPGMQINLSLLNPLDSTKRQTTASITGTFQLGGVNVPVYLGASLGSTTSWSFGLQPNETVTLPSFSDLLELAGGKAFMDSLPQGLAEIPQIEINTLFTDFDATNNVLTQLQFKVSTASSWPVISGYFSIEKMSVGFDITDLTDPLKREIYGALYGIFKIGDSNYLMCSLNKTADNPEWAITAGLAPGTTLSLNTIAAQLFENKVTIPESIPDFSFSILQVVVVPERQSFRFDAQSADVWRITDKIAINIFTLSFIRDPNDPVNPIQGSVATVLQISKVGVNLSASINNTPNGGWQFNGSTQEGDPIVIGDLIAYIMDKFGVPNPPAWIRTITLLNLSAAFNSTTKDFSFGATAKIMFTTTELAIQVDFALNNGANNSYTLVLTGTITIQHATGNGKSIFTINFITGTTNTQLSAAWEATSPAEYLQLADIVQAFGFDMPEVPAGLDLALKRASLLYDFSSSTLAFSLESANYGKAVFVAMRNPANQQWVFFFGLASNCIIDLTNLPIIDKLTFLDAGKLEISAINVNFVSAITDKVLAAAINKQIQELVPDAQNYPSLPAEGMNGQVSFSMTLNIGGTLYPLNLVLGGATGQELMLADNTGTMELMANDNDAVKTKWFNLQKNFGPLYFDKIGIGYKNSKIYVLVNVMATASGLSIALNGFGIGVGISSFDIAFNLDGISITYSSGPVLITGGLMGSFSPVSLYGDILVKTATLAIGGIGGYTEVGGKPSMFLYAVLNFPLGGPPFFFVTGLSAGFGYNRKLVIPDITGVATFPFVVWSMPGSSAPVPDPTKDLKAQINAVLTEIEEKGIVAPEVGSAWLAAGINFTSFEMVSSFALLTVIFGTRLEIALLGLSRVVIPPGSGGSTGIPAVAFAELAIKASYVDGSGLISIQGQLTDNSYILAKSCHLTGGFAFYFWFSGAYEGDFVITLGGYNPNYTPPVYYPRVPRLGVEWKVDSHLLIRGSLYFALTSNAVMAGGMMEAVWQSGGIRAWFLLQADFLIMWKPFHYDIVANTDIGASFTIDLWFTSKTITIHVGVGLHVWGPDFSGKATIDLAIISFTISFGAGSTNKPRTISWEEFTKEMLPQQQVGDGKGLEDSANPDVCKVLVTDGLLMQLSDKAGELNWIVSAEKFVLSTDAVIPSKDWDFDNNNNTDIFIQLDPAIPAPTQNVDFGVRPVGLDNNAFASTQIIEVTSSSGEKATFHATPILKNVPKGLWQKINFNKSGNPDVGDPVNDTTLKNVLTGFSLAPYREVSVSTLPIQLEYLQFNLAPELQEFIWTETYIPVTDSFNNETVPGTIMGPKAMANRPLLLNAINNNVFNIDVHVNVDELADTASYYLLATPQLRLLGEEKTDS